jgi:hypothetical protein
MAAALAPVPFLLPRAPTLWCVPAAAPLLGAIGLAPVYLALAGLAPTAWRRAGLGAAGLLWLVMAEVITGEALLFGLPDGVLDAAVWDQSAARAAEDALYPLLTSPALAPAVVWAALAATLSLCVRGRSVALDLLRGAAWAAAGVALHAALGDLMASSVELGDARGAAAGAILGLLAALGAAALAPARDEDPLT